MATLLIANSGGEPRRVVVPEEGETMIGRHSDCGVVIPDRHLSSKHACFRFDKESEKFYLRDLASHNGTRVNGTQLGKEEVLLRESDSIVFGILEATLLRDRPVRALSPKPLERPKIAEPASEIPIIDVEAIKAATRKPEPTPKPISESSGKVADHVSVEEVCRELIKRIDLIDDLLERYRAKKDKDTVMDLEVLKQSFQDMLVIYQVETFSFDPDTEINLEMRKKIEIVDGAQKGQKGKNGKGSKCIAETLYQGYVRVPEGEKPIILRKAHVTTRTILPK